MMSSALGFFGALLARSLNRRYQIGDRPKNPERRK
jgi:hypothetical protein